MAVTETKTGAWYGLATYGTELYTTASNTLAVDESVAATGSVGSVTVVEGVGDTATPLGVSATGIANDDLLVRMVFIPDSVSATVSVNAEQTDLHNGFRVNTNFENAYYGQGVYGVSIYGDTSAPTETEVTGVQGTGNVTGVTVSASSDTTLEVSVFAEIITDAAGVVGDEVTVVAKAVTVPTGVEGTTAINDVEQRTENTIIPTPVVGTGEVTTAVVAADANFTPQSAEGTGEVGDGLNFQSRYTPESVEGTGEVTTVSIAENAQPTFSGVTATNSPGNVTISTTTVIFNSANKDHDRTTYVEPDKPRIVYVRAA